MIVTGPDPFFNDPFDHDIRAARAYLATGKIICHTANSRETVYEWVGGDTCVFCGMATFEKFESLIREGFLPFSFDVVGYEEPERITIRIRDWHADYQTTEASPIWPAANPGEG